MTQNAIMAKATGKVYATLSALDPQSGKAGQFHVTISSERAAHIRTRGAVHALEMGYFLPETLNTPKAVYEGIRWNDDGDGEPMNHWYCFVSQPIQALAGVMQPPIPEEPGDLFLVFVNDRRVAYSWRWEKPDPSNGLPKQAETRFGKRIM